MSASVDNDSRLQGEQAVPAEAKAFEREVLSELVRLHAQVLKRMPLIQTLLVIGLAFMVLRSVPASVFFVWSLSTIGAECLRAFYAWKLLRQNQPFDPVRVHKQLIVLAGVVAATVGWGITLFMPLIPLPDQALLTVVLFTMPAVGVSVAVSSRQILAVYALFILAPTAMAWINIFPRQMLSISILTCLYWGFIVSVAADGEQLLRRSVAIRRELDRVVKDLEQRNQEVTAAVAKAEQSSQARARVLAAASHDLRQPLHALSVYSAVLSANPAPEALPEVARNIDRLVRSLGGLLHGLLDLSRLSSEYYVPEQQPMALQCVVQEVCKEYEAPAADKQLRLVYKLEPVPLCDDPLAIARIARNLLDNAVKYTDCGEVRVETRIEGDGAVLVIEDTGKGIPGDEQGRIFEEFYQLGNPGRDQTRGIGLGLAIVQRLCELIDARISLVSSPALGSRFTVRFRSVMDYGQEQPSALPGEAMCLQGKRIYIIDDEIDILDSMRVLLQAWQVQVGTAKSSEAAVALFNKRGKPDLLLVDLRLQGAEHGAALAARLQRRYGAFPVLVVTGETASEALQQTNAAGYPLLQKPITAEVLYGTVCKLMGNA